MSKPAESGAGRFARLRRRTAGALTLGIALGAVSLAYTALVPSDSAAQDDALASADVRAGERLYEQTCITCHGRNLQGVEDRGPSLDGAGAAAVYFQVSTGRMPAVRQESEVERRPPRFTDEEANQIAAYVQSVTGGPVIPGGDLRDGDLAEGGELFRLNCASCHNFAGQGGALSGGKRAPDLSESTDEQVYGAMLSGPESMPVFSDGQVTPEQKRAIINYVQTLKAANDPGGNGIGQSGPVPEGLVVWVVGIGVLIVAIAWIGAKS